MTEAEWQDDEISLFAVGTVLVRSRWRIGRWMFVGGALAALLVFSRPALYSASASFFPEEYDAGTTGVAGLVASQFGTSFSSESPAESPAFYVGLLQSRELLGPIVRDTFLVQEMGGERLSFLELFKVEKVEEEVAKRREEAGVEALRRMITTSVTTATGVVELSVQTEWPSVSLALATALLDGVNEFNQRMRRERASAESEFVEGRLALAGAELREAEDRLESFLGANRQFGTSALLTFEEERLQRAVIFRQQIYTALGQSYEEVRMRAVRDTPVITVVETPAVPALPESRGRLRSGLLGIILGGIFGVLVVFLSERIGLLREEGDAGVEEFLGVLGEMRDEILRPVRWIRGRSQG
jgi:uncharacterized protein involved in exopolysaccharide biosynthesis